MTNSSESDGGIRVFAHPVFLAGHSDPLEPRYVFAYRIRIENHGGGAARLVWRHWFIHDPVAGDQEVEGEGVVGEQPRIVPGGAHEYESFCILQAPEGHMEGYYEFRRDDSSTFRAPVPRFPLKVIHA